MPFFPPPAIAGCEHPVPTSTPLVAGFLFTIVLVVFSPFRAIELALAPRHAQSRDSVARAGLSPFVRTPECSRFFSREWRSLPRHGGRGGGPFTLRLESSPFSRSFTVGERSLGSLFPFFSGRYRYSWTFVIVVVFGEGILSLFWVVLRVAPSFSLERDSPAAESR